jgi:hypothetical protein
MRCHDGSGSDTKITSHVPCNAIVERTSRLTPTMRRPRLQNEKERI